jgi:L-alanine-DL-glutamate epimerase-like enolase superfamily enzyme
MLQLKYKILDYAFEYPFALAKGLKTHQPALLVSLSFNKFKGLGETTEIGYYHASVNEMAETLDSKRAVIESYSMNSPERFWHFLHHLLPGDNFLISALDMAGWDLWAKMNNKTVQQLLGIEPSGKEPVTDYTIGFNDPEAIRSRVQEKPFPAYKLKIGGSDDLAALEALREATNALIRVDANEGLSLEEALSILPYLEKYDVELLEQPLHRDDIEGLEVLKRQTSIPIIADEACRDEQDLVKCLGRYDGINIKLSKCGGLTPALSMIKTIKTAGKKVMLGGMCENVTGATALAQLLPFADYADIDGPLLFKAPYGKGLVYEGGRISLPKGFGFGVTLPERF